MSCYVWTWLRCLDTCCTHPMSQKCLIMYVYCMCNFSKTSMIRWTYGDVHVYGTVHSIVSHVQTELQFVSPIYAGSDQDALKRKNKAWKIYNDDFYPQGPISESEFKKHLTGHYIKRVARFQNYMYINSSNKLVKSSSTHVQSSHQKSELLITKRYQQALR